jgi:cytochrome c biogenesis protein CcmG/thiol:disulfide interchange protein DsbE
VLNFWASWCAPCRAEAPALGAISRAFANKGVTFVGIAIQDTPENSQAFVRRYGVPYVNVADARGEASFSYAVAGLPSTFLIDREGRLVRRWVGPLAEKQLVAAIEDLQS